MVLRLQEVWRRIYHKLTKSNHKLTKSKPEVYTTNVPARACSYRAATSFQLTIFHHPVR